MLNLTNIALRNNLIIIPSDNGEVGPEAMATVMMNLSYFGKSLSVEAYKALGKLSPSALAAWWDATESELKSISGADRKMADFMVYKNFPAEVLSKSEADYWIPQILMYWGFPKELLTEEVKPREKMSEQPKCTVLHLVKKDSLQKILSSLLKEPARWNDPQFADVLYLSNHFPINVGSIGFKENLVKLVAALMEKGQKINLSTGTDVLRLMAGLSDGDVSLREKCKFKSFKKPVRRYLLSMLEGCGNLSEDFARRPEVWKKALHNLHPGDFKRAYPKVCQAMNGLYHDELTTFNAQVENLIREKDSRVLELLASRPGDFRRRLSHMLDLFGNKAVKAFDAEVIGKLTTAQVVSLRSYLETIGARDFRTVPPKGNWSKLKIMEPRPVAYKYASALCKVLSADLARRVPKVKVLDQETHRIKLPSNGEEGPYARGTSFPIPEGIQFIRTASYWQVKNRHTVWFDNGWNFFGSDWTPKHSICWNETHVTNGAAAFSGDPLSSKDSQGRACQVIDLYLDKLAALGVRYAVWNILCFSRVSFSQADEVFASLQWGEDANTGKVFEPSRAQITFPLTGDAMTKFVVLVDIEKREMIFLDANLKGNTSGARYNGETLQKTMPAFMEYIASLPSVHDLFRDSVSAESDTHVLYSDKDHELKGEPAYVFRTENKANKFKSVDINSILT